MGKALGGILISVKIISTSETETRQLGERLGRQLVAGETLQLVGDVGAGKTTFVKGLALGMGITDTIQSPTFTISRVYEAPDGRRLVHYDFYRLADPGIMVEDVSEALDDPQTITVIEWADSVVDVLPQDHITIQFATTTESERMLTITIPEGASNVSLD